ncbi:hypothetical protein [Fibrella aquatica]|jgi:hypothetical protein|uniref:hypothetical protein n=1 Tax=Fibrella aquatica TaxID=3242487 RepID=UPI0035226852
METQNLWPDFPVQESKGPKTILSEQARYLTEQTNNILSAAVTPSAVPNNERIQYTLFIIAPLLNDYRYKLLTISYDLAVNYPLYITWRYEEDPKKEILSEEEFIKELRMIFNDPTTISVVSSLLAQSRTEALTE